MYTGHRRASKYEHPPVTFDLFSKVDVNGPNADPVFKYLRQSLDGRLEHDPRPHEVTSEGLVKGNFNKWLVDKHGRVRFHFGKRATLKDFEPSVQALLEEELLP